MITEQKNGDNKAVFSECGAYRYSLTWALDTYPDARRGVCVFIMLNPSTADAFNLDPTLTRCKRFAEREGCGWMHIVNLFAYRATDPKDMKSALDPVGVLNDRMILDAIEAVQLAGGTLICGWGTHGVHENRNERVLELIKGSGLKAHALKLTKAGHPSHPLYLKSDSELIEMKLD